MSFELEERVRFGYYGDSQLRKTILLTLAAYADDDGTNVFPSNETIAGIVLCSSRAVRDHVRVLKEEGILIPGGTSERYAKLPEGRRPNLWRINYEKINKVARKDVRDHLKMLRELRSEEEGRGERGSGVGGNEVPPKKSTEEVNLPISSSLPSIQSEPPALANPTNYPHVEREDPPEEATPEGREDEEESIPFTETQSPTGNQSSLQSGTLYAEKIEADSVDPEEMASRHLKGLGLPWTPHPTPYLATKRSCPDIDLDMVITTYIAWCFDNGAKPSLSQWIGWVEKRQREENARQKDMREKATAERVRKRSWIARTIGGEF